MIMGYALYTISKWNIFMCLGLFVSSCGSGKVLVYDFDIFLTKLEFFKLNYCHIEHVFIIFQYWT